MKPFIHDHKIILTHIYHLVCHGRAGEQQSMCQNILFQAVPRHKQIVFHDGIVCDEGAGSQTARDHGGGDIVSLHDDAFLVAAAVRTFQG